MQTYTNTLMHKRQTHTYNTDTYLQQHTQLYNYIKYEKLKQGKKNIPNQCKKETYCII